MPRDKIVLIDNYDSYTYNLADLIWKVSKTPPLVVKNDDFGGDGEEFLARLRVREEVALVVISPGPGSPYTPRDVGLSKFVCEVDLGNEIAVFGVCLGFQLLAIRYGCRVVRAEFPMHGVVDEVRIDASPSRLFGGPAFADVTSFKAVRYHSLIAVDFDAHEVSKRLVPLATVDGVVMAFEHVERPIFGVLFHPESICSERGEEIVQNVLKSVGFLSRDAREQHREADEERIPGRVKLRIDYTCVELSQDRLDEVETFRRVILSSSSSSATSSRFETDSPLKRTKSAMTETNEQRHGDDDDDDDDVFWLDSCPSRSFVDARFSYMGRCKHPRRSNHGDSPPPAAAAAARLSFYLDPTKQRMGMNETHAELRDLGTSRLVVETTTEGLREMRGEAADPFSHLGAFLEEIEVENLEIVATQLPFAFLGGFVGVVGYGARKLGGSVKTGRAIEELQTSSSSTSNFLTVDDTASSPDVVFTFCDRFMALDSLTNTVYLVTLSSASNQAEQSRWREHGARSLATVSPIGKESLSPSPPPLVIHPNKSRAEYEASVEASKRRLEEGESYEVCLTTRFEGTYPFPSLPRAFELYVSLRHVNPAPMCAFFHSPRARLALACTSPERFLRVGRNGEVESSPIKGTAGRIPQDPAEDARVREALAVSPKNRAENLMIVDLTRNDLARVCLPGTVTVPELMHVRSYETVHQMVSVVKGRLRGQGSKAKRRAAEALAALFPPPSMTGAPKLRTMQVIDEIQIEGSGPMRGLYSGCFGYLGIGGTCDFNVLIRSVFFEWDDSERATEVGRVMRAYVGSGGAVTSQSLASEEYEEMRLKVGALGKGGLVRVDGREE